MRVTVVFEDNKVNVNGDALFELGIVPSDSNWRIIQWFGESGWIEVYTGDRKWITDFSIVDPYVNIYNQKKEEMIAIEQSSVLSMESAQE